MMGFFIIFKIEGENMPTRLELTKNVQFYKTNNGLDDGIISNVLNEAASNQEPDSDSVIDTYRDIKITTENTDTLLIKYSGNCCVNAVRYSG